MSKVSSIVLYFTAGMLPTAVETAEILRLQTVMENVRVRSGAVAADTLFSGNIEACDFVAGKAIPATYTDAPASKTTLAIPSTVNPDDFKVFPAVLSIDASDLDVQTPAAVKAEIDAALGLAKMTNMTGDATCTWASSDATKATVNASTGKIAAVAAGATTITATLRSVAAKTAVAIAVTGIATKVAHGFLTGEQLDLVSLTGGTGLTAGTPYFAIKLTDDTFKFASSYANAVAGTAVAVSVLSADAVVGKAAATATMALTVVA
jgi:hypothetical protein